MKHNVKKKQQNSKTCLVCGLENKLGLKASFYELDNDELVAIFQPLKEHQSYPGRLHGGISAAILDETIGRVIMIQDEKMFGVTVDLNLKYKKPVSLDQELRVVARLTRNSSRIFEGTGEILLANGEVAVSGWGKYMKIPMGKMTEFDPEEEKWHVIPTAKDPITIDIGE